MIKNYIITAFRSLIQNRVTSAINITGLAAGIAASVLILLYVFTELSVDKFNENYEHIYRLEIGDFIVNGTAPAILLKESFPEIRQTVRLDFRYNPLAAYNDDNFRLEDFIYADSTFFDVFTFQFVRGDPDNALKRPFSLVLTESEAKRIFGNEDPVGRMITLNRVHEFTITAIVKDLSNSHLTVSSIGSFSTLPYIENDENHDRHLFSYMNFFTYVLFHDNVDPVFMAKKFDKLIDERFPETRSFGFRFRPLSDIYFNRDLDDSPPVRHGNQPLIYTLIAVAGFIWLIAIVNFINLATANASARSTEIGVRKVMGAGRINLIFQFLAESVIMSVFAFIAGIVLVEMLIPVFNNLLLTDLSFDPFYSPRFFIILMMLVMITGILAGLYPAFYLSSVKTGDILSGSLTKGKGALRFRRFLIIFQFAISIALITGTLIVHRQVDYMRNKPRGYERDNVIVLRLNRDIFSSSDVFRDNLLQHEEIVSVSMSNNFPGYVTWFETWIRDGERKPHKFLPVDPDYLDLMGIELTDGRNFDWDRIADQERTYILNEEAVKYFGFEDPVGKEFMVGRSEPVRIIGVVENFHFRSLHEPIGPLVLSWRPGNLRVANIRIAEKNENTINFIREEWEKLSPGYPFEYSFLGDEIDKLYHSELRISRLFNYFALLAVIIACMGLYGLSTFIAYQRTREMGIRKVLGASVFRIMVLLVSEFVRWVVVANILAWPVAYFIMAKWLDNFPYRIEQSVIVFVSAGLAALVIAVITVGGQAWLTASLNPAHTLKSE